ncbi:MAG: phosphonate ABC transporter, permease protein PhnE [Firmicutes bacterium]|nr:phosphonate ABC transporter, permease protein PhnE [Bacillota bacterium]
MRFLLVLMAVAAVYGASAAATEFHPVVVVRDADVFVQLLGEMWPDNRERWVFLLTDFLPRLKVPFIQTLQIAILGTLAGAVLAVPFVVLASNNLTRNPVVYAAAKALMNLLRTVPELLYASIFVAAVGFGPFPGVLALTVFSMAIVAKLTSESVEAVDPGPLEALEAAGATRAQVIAYAVVPQVLPLFVSYVLYVFEINVRVSTVLGLVGAGGIGQQLQLMLSLFQYENAFIIILATFVLVAAIDYASARVRARLV